MKKNLILTIAENYNYEKIKPFVESLQNTGFNGDLVIFCHNLDKNAVKKLKEKKVTLVEYKKNPIRLNLSKEKKINFILSKKLHIFQYRHILYYLFLKKYSHKYKNVFLTDIRDVIFQKDPFDFNLGNKLNVFLEEEKIKDCPINSKWIIESYGNNIYNTIKSNLISCAGTTIGSTANVFKYLKKMIRNVETYWCDQAVHNYLIYTGKIKLLKLNYNFDGPVLTMGKIPLSKIKKRFDKKSKLLLNESLETINVLHQYDVFFPIIKKYKSTRIPLYVRKIKSLPLIGNFLKNVKRRLDRNKGFKKLYKRLRDA